MLIQDIEQTIDRVLDGAYVNGGCGRNKWKTPCRCVSTLIAHVKNDGKILDGVGWFNDDGAQCHARDIKTFKLGKVGSGAEPDQLCLVWVEL